MEGDAGGVPAGALEDIAYLARSANRVRLLETLAAGSYGRRDLEDVTGIAPATIGRILNELEERGWAERTSDGAYAATATGTLVVSEFAPLVEAMATIRSLGEAAAWIPFDELSIGVSHFGDATVRSSPPNAPLGAVEYLAARFEAAAAIRVLTFLVAPSPIADAFAEGLETGRVTAEVVLAGGLVDFLRERDEPPPDWTQYVGDGVRVYRYGEHIPCHLFILDDTVLVMDDRPEEGVTMIESEDETVLAAVNDLFETYRNDAEPIGAGVFE